MGGFGGGGGKGSTGGGGGLSTADIGLIQQAFGMGSEMISNRYHQLGLGVPSGDPLQAAQSGTSLQYAGPSTMEQMDIHGLGNLAEAQLGQLQTANTNNPAIPGTAANQIQQNNQLAQIAQSAGFSQGFSGSGGTGGGSATNLGTAGT